MGTSIVFIFSRDFGLSAKGFCRKVNDRSLIRDACVIYIGNPMVPSQALSDAPSGQASEREFWIDVGGTFTDCLLREADGSVRACKVLSSGRIKGRVLGPGRDGRTFKTTLNSALPGLYDGYDVHFGETCNQEAMQTRIVRSAEGYFEFDQELAPGDLTGRAFELTSGEPAPVLGIRMLLGLGLGGEVGPAEVRLGTTRATNALLERKGVRTAWLTTEGFEDVLAIGNQDRPRLFDLHIRKPEPLYERAVGVMERLGAEGEVLTPLDEEALKLKLEALKKDGVGALAVGLLHAYRNGVHERRIRTIAREAGFSQVSLSSEVSPTIRIVPRGDTTVADAYLTPVVHDYLESIQKRLPEARLRVMTSGGALVSTAGASGKDLVLSGPAGGVVGLAGVAREAGLKGAIGFDMGGTSTDVSRYDGEFEYEYETQKAGVRIVSPMLSIETVAAGGGSICGFDGQKLTVGPESAGAEPGPACYGRGGPLAVTDLNFFLGRLSSEHFPFHLDEDAVRIRIGAIRKQSEAAGGEPLSNIEIAEGFLRIANAHMAAAIKRISVARGYDIRRYGLVSFGGAAGQHACAVARELGIATVLVHPFAGVLSAYGMGVAEVSRFAVRSVLKRLGPAEAQGLEPVFDEMEARLTDELREQEGEIEATIESQRQLEVRYRGQSTTLSVDFRDADGIRAAFEASHEKLYGHLFEGREVEIVNARVQMTVKTSPPEAKPPHAHAHYPEPFDRRGVVFEGVNRDTPFYSWDDLGPGAEIEGPALIMETNSTVVLEPGWSARKTEQGHLRMEDRSGGTVRSTGAEEVNPIDLEIFNNHYASIAEQMGAILRRTSLSVNVKERLDFSCAIFTAKGDLVANAPHVPVHLGAMSECVKQMLRDVPDLEPGDVILTNDPLRGGSHLPDLTVITPVFEEEGSKLLFLTASRAHHADIGGIRPGSMPPDSKNLAEEGVVIRNFRVMAGGVACFEELRRLLLEAPYPSRAPEENLADVSAQIAANRQGAAALKAMLERFGRERTLAYMGHIQRAAEAKMRECLRRFGDGVYTFEDALDDGSRVCVKIVVQDGSATLDFTGSAGVHQGNLNANRAIVSAAVIYCFRCLIGEDIPLNSGVLAPLEIILPEGMLNPPVHDDPAQCPAVVGGNVETSQRIVDVIFGALGAVAASQGTMNNLTFGNERFGYYETLCGGSGAGPGFAGADAVHTHMTNTRLTDAEVLEKEYPVRLRRFGVREGSGGGGEFKGGRGVIREIEFLEPMSVSLLTQRRQRAPYGLAGGGSGAMGVNRLLKGGEIGEGQDLGGTARLEAAPGDRLIIETPGGGGYGSS